MDEILRGAVERNDLFRVLNCINERTESMNRAWSGTDCDDIENILRLYIQEIEDIKAEYPELKTKVVYHLGRLDGFASAYEEAYRAKKQMDAAVEELSQHSAKSMQILRCLYEHGTMRHSELADAVNSSYSALTNIMKKILLSGAVKSARTGKNTLYYLTETGKRCCEKRPKGELEELKRNIVDMRYDLDKILTVMAPNGLPEQKLSVGERVTPICGEKVLPAISVDKIIKVGSQKFLCFTTNKETNIQVSRKLFYGQKFERIAEE